MVRKTLKWLSLILVVLAVSVQGLAQETITLVPFSDEAYAIEGVIPDGWTKAGSGLYVRGSSATDFTLIALQAAPLNIDALWQALMPQLGLDAVPEAVGETVTDAFTWTVYQIDVTQAGVTVKVDVALAELDGTTYVVLLQTAPEEYETLHAEVFVPVVDALAPLVLDVAPVPYLVEEVTFENGDITLAGTLTLPEVAGPHPAVVLMTGSGAQDRDEMVVPGFRIFQKIADALTRAGVAVLRYDDRGVAKSTGDYSTASISDLASDGQAAVDYLKTREDVDPDQIGVLGHSEGGLYAAMMGANPDSGVAFIIAMAGPAVPGKEVLLAQNELILEVSGASQELIDSQLAFLNELFPLLEARDFEAMEQLVYDTLLNQWALLTPEEQASTGFTDAETYAEQSAEVFSQGYAVEWFASFMEYDPGEDWAKTTVPVLAILGGLDVQVPDEQSAPAFEEALTQAGNEDFEVIVLPDANHLFQQAVTGGLEEYTTLDLEFTPDFLPTIVDWVLEHVELPQ